MCTNLLHIFGDAYSWQSAVTIDRLSSLLWLGLWQPIPPMRCVTTPHRWLRLLQHPLNHLLDVVVMMSLHLLLGHWHLHRTIILNNSPFSVVTVWRTLIGLRRVTHFIQSYDHLILDPAKARDTAVLLFLASHLAKLQLLLRRYHQLICPSPKY